MKTLPKTPSRKKRIEPPRVDYRVFNLRDKFVFDGATVIADIPDMKLPDWQILKTVMQQTAENFMSQRSQVGVETPDCTVTSGFAVAGRVVEVTAKFELVETPNGVPKLEMRNEEIVERNAKYLNAVLN